MRKKKRKVEPPKPKPRTKEQNLLDGRKMPAHLRGLGHMVLFNQRGFRGGTKAVAAGPARTLSKEEKAEIEKRLHDEGKL